MHYEESAYNQKHVWRIRRNSCVDKLSIRLCLALWMNLFMKSTYHINWTQSCSDALPQLVLVLVAQSCPVLCNPFDYIPLGFSVHGMLQARILEWVSLPFSRGSSQARDWTWVSHITGSFLTIWTTRPFYRIVSRSALPLVSFDTFFKLII